MASDLVEGNPNGDTRPRVGWRGRKADPALSGSRDDFVWVFEISGAAPPSHHEGTWAGSDSLRQSPIYFPSEGGTLRGVARPGPIVWSRICVADHALHMDVGRGEADRLSEKVAVRHLRNGAMSHRLLVRIHG